MKWTVATALCASFGLAWRNFGAFWIVAMVLSLPSVAIDFSAAHPAISTIVSSLVVTARRFA